MDVTDIGKVASRKRMNTDAEKLREKVSRETAKIIKLKVAQDTAYWDLKERLQQLQGAHERLQQNMVDVQMQHEAASAHYTQELRLRPDTLNKVAGTRGVCDALEQWGARLRGCVARCRADCGALQAAYAQCGARLRSLAAELGQARAARDSHDAAARAAQARSQADARALADAREQLGAARASAAERAAAADQLAARLRQADEAAAAMRDEVSRLVRQFDAQTTDMKLCIARHEDEARRAREAEAQLQRDAEARERDLRRARDQLADAKNTVDLLKQEQATHISEINNLEKVINEKNQHERDMETEISSIKQCVSQLESEKLEAREQLNESARECAALRSARDELARAAELRGAQLAELQAALLAQREAAAASERELRAAADARSRELDASTGTIARLMSDLRAESDARARADAALAAARRTHDDELAAQMSVIRDMRAEKERLQERIQGMQNTIDNIQKELTGRLAAPKGADVGEAPEPGPRPAELYSFLSDGSVDGDALDPREVGRRFSALEAQARGAARLTATQGSISLSQVKDELKIKSRTFFKNKRFDSKSKKIK